MTANQGSLGRQLAIGAASLVALAALGAGAAGAGIASLLGDGGSPPSATATGTIPAAMLPLYQQAAATCPGLPWTVLAAIGTIESDNGRNDGPSSAGAEVFWGCDLGLWHVRQGPRGGRSSLVSDGCESPGRLSHRLRSVPPHDGQISGVACRVAF